MNKFLINILGYIIWGFLSFFQNEAFAQDYIYETNEIEIKINNFNILSKYKYQDVINLIGSTKEFYKSSDAVTKKQGYRTYQFHYGKSYVTFANGKISEIDISDKSLFINGIRLGDSVYKVNKIFKKSTKKPDRIEVYYGYLNIYFEHVKGKVSKMVCYIPM